MSNTSSEQVKEIVDKTSRIEQQLREMNKDIKQISQSIDNKKLSESIMQIQSQIVNLETDLAKIDKTINDALAILPIIKKKDKKKKDKSKGTGKGKGKGKNR